MCFQGEGVEQARKTFLKYEENDCLDRMRKCDENISLMEGKIVEMQRTVDALKEIRDQTLTQLNTVRNNLKDLPRLSTVTEEEVDRRSFLPQPLQAPPPPFRIPRSQDDQTQADQTQAQDDQTQAQEEQVQEEQQNPEVVDITSSTEAQTIQVVDVPENILQQDEIPDDEYQIKIQPSRKRSSTESVIVQPAKKRITQYQTTGVKIPTGSFTVSSGRITVSQAPTTTPVQQPSQTSSSSSSSVPLFHQQSVLTTSSNRQRSSSSRSTPSSTVSSSQSAPSSSSTSQTIHQPIPSVVQSHVMLLPNPVKKNIETQPPVPINQQDPTRKYCTTCVKSFKQQSHLNEHKKRCGFQIYTHKCGVCHIMFTTKRTAEDHETKFHTGGYSYVCKYCNAYFQTQPELSRHTTSKHSKK